MNNRVSNLGDNLSPRQAFILAIQYTLSSCIITFIRHVVGSHVVLEASSWPRGHRTPFEGLGIGLGLGSRPRPIGPYLSKTSEKS